jgi:tRNA pseudouridine13 synthase
MEKEGIDSNHALIEIEHQFHIRLRVMGIKDAKALTRQYAGAETVTKNPLTEMKTSHVRLTLEGFTKRPIGREFLAGNDFCITIADANPADLPSFIPQIEKIGNFYGLQRFGSERLVTHLVGREIVKRQFGKAVETLLSYTTEYDSPSSREIRARISDPANYHSVLKALPRGMDIERSVLAALVAGKDSVSALRAVPINIRRLFVQAYQAFVFNRCLSVAIRGGAELVRPESGDLCFEMEDPETFGRVMKFENMKEDKNAVPAVRMAGYSFQGGKGRFEALTEKILEEEEVKPKDFYIKEMQELSHQGGFRQAPLWCKGFSYERGPPLTVSFRLPKGSYATTLLREIIRPQDPIRSGF